MSVLRYLRRRLRDPGPCGKLCRRREHMGHRPYGPHLYQIWLGSVFDEEDPDGKGYIDQNTAVQLIRQTNPTLSLSRIKNKVKEAGSALGGIERGRIHKEEFVELYKVG
ncbi:hypothetical protein OSTOST_04226 [Ostertagia ostertagi]